MMSTGVVTSPELRIGTPVVLFEARFDRASDLGHAYYDVSPDGERFLVTTDASAVEIQVVTNCFEERKRLAPSAR